MTFNTEDLFTFMKEPKNENNNETINELATSSVKVTQEEKKTNIEDLLNELSQDTNSENQKEKTQKTKSSKTNKSIQAVSSENFNINADTVIRYHREIYSILDFFSTDEVENGIKIIKNDDTVEYKKIDEELVRARMEKAGFLEFVKGYSQFNYFGGERNFIIPCIISKKKGHMEISIDKNSNKKYLQGLEPKIPFTLLGQFIAVAKMLGRLNLEVLGEFYFNYDTNEYMLHIPFQQVNDFWCLSKEEPGEFKRKMLIENGQSVELVCEIHSHHSLLARPSSLDDQSERVPSMFYVIVGETDKERPDVFVRTFTPSGNHVEKRLEDIFIADDFCDEKFETLPRFKAKWIEIVR